MAICKICGNKINYNQYKVVKGEVYCPGCAKTLKADKKKAKQERKIKTRQKEKTADLEDFNPHLANEEKQSK